MKKIQNTIDHIQQEQKDIAQHSRSITRPQSQTSFKKKNQKLEKLLQQKENVLKEFCTFQPTINDKYTSADKKKKSQGLYNNVFEKLNEYLLK